MEFVGQSISVLHNGKKCIGVLEEICLERQEIRLKTTTGQLVLNAAEIEDLQVLDVVERYFTSLKFRHDYYRKVMIKTSLVRQKQRALRLSLKILQY